MHRILGRFRRDQSANVALLFAFLLPMMLVGAALGVDSAALYLQRRQMQGALDLAAMAAASEPARAFAIVQRELERAGAIPPGLPEAALRAGTAGPRLSVETGRYTADAALAPALRFATGSTPPNAVRAALDRPGELFFARSWSLPPGIGVSSVAAAKAEGSFVLGSRLLRVGGGLPAALLGGLLGSGVDLDVMSYDRLVGAKVTLLGVFKSLAQDLSLGLASYGDLYAADVTEGALARAIAGALSGVERAAMTQIAANIGRGSTLPLRRLIDLGDWGGAAIGSNAPGLDASVGALDLLGMGAALSDGNHQVALNLATVLPGLTSLTLRLTVGEPPQVSGWMALGPTGQLVRNIQLRLQLDASIGGGSLLSFASIAVPISLDIASADARIANLSCPSTAAPNGGATIEVRPSAVRLTLGAISPSAIRDFGRPLSASPVAMVDLALLRIHGRAQTDLGSSSSTLLQFSSAEIGAGTIKTARSTGMVQSATQSLFDTLTLDVRILGLGLLPEATLAAALRTAIAPLTPLLDTVVDSVLATLGLSLGEADVKVLGVRCLRPVLVQ